MDSTGTPYISYGNLDKARSIFNYCVENSFDVEAIEKYALSLNMTAKSIKRLAYIYYLYANDAEKAAYDDVFSEASQKRIDRSREKFFLRSKRAEYITLFDELSKTDCENEIFNILLLSDANKKISHAELREAAYSYAFCLNNGLTIEEKGSLCDSLRKKVATYYRKTNEKRIVQKKLSVNASKSETEKDKIEVAKNCIESHLNDMQASKTYEKSDFEELKKLLLFMKKYDINLYENYKKKQDEIKKDMLEREIEVAVIIMDIIKQKTKEQKDFTLLDYHLLTNIPLEKFYNIVKGFNCIADTRFVKSLIDKRKNTRPIKEQAILDANIILNINGELVIVNEDDKNIVINFLNERKIELLESIVYLALKKYLSGEIIIDCEQINCMIKRR